MALCIQLKYLVLIRTRFQRIGMEIVINFDMNVFYIYMEIIVCDWFLQTFYH